MERTIERRIRTLAARGWDESRIAARCQVPWQRIATVLRSGGGGA